MKNKPPRIPFSTAFQFIATGPLTMNGIAYNTDDDVDLSALSDYRQQQLFNNRKIRVKTDANGNPIAKHLVTQAEADETAALLAQQQAEADEAARVAKEIADKEAQAEAEKLAKEQAESAKKNDDIDLPPAKPAMPEAGTLQAPKVSGKYSIKHTGGGWWKVFDNQGNEMTEGLKKDAAITAMDALENK